jgi:hypothetical protein
MKRYLIVLSIAALLSTTGCGDSSSSSTTAPSATSVALNGTYSGNASDSSGPGRMTWRLTQTGTAVSGTMTASTPLGTVVFNGNFSGTLSGTTLTFTIAVPAGGVSAFPSCTITITGSAANVTSSAITGVYTGTSTCSAPFNNGTLTLTKQ